jgi:DNA helicase-2/ATP-dependent DNA helicase PcrA
MFDGITVITPDDAIDDHVDKEIQKCIREKKHFFMFAGAGSGKTRSLVNALQFIANEYGMDLRLCSKQVAVITYTNVACDEIMRRVGYKSLFAVSTIHSFLWELVKSYQKDIKEWVKSKLVADIDELRAKQDNPRRRRDYSEDISKKQERLDNLVNISRFTYNPNGENVGRDSLGHSEVISMGSAFISDRETMQKVMISRFPILLIDESQDTKKDLVDALWKIENIYAGDFLIGMFGDTMQRIYTDGKENLSQIVPQNWDQPAKVMNHRSTKRIIQLANAIRNTVDDQQQQARSNKSEGVVRLFIVPKTADKDSAEQRIYSQMAEITGDDKWVESSERKTLVLEHSMAASRLGFGALDERLKTFDQSFKEGTLVELSFLMKVVFPLIQEKQNGNDFAVMKILKEYSPKLERNNFSDIPDQLSVLQAIRMNVDDLVSLWKDDKFPICLDVYKKLYKMNLFELPKRIEEILSDSAEVSEDVIALREGLRVPFSELINYWNYVNDNTQFSTHQGIKGLEFDRVAVIMDDESARGFLFSYEKLFGAKKLTDTDLEHEKNGEDNSISRTKRLFYVTCTRAKEGLVLIAYTSNVDAVKRTAISNSWFSEDEIILINEISASETIGLTS